MEVASGLHWSAYVRREADMEAMAQLGILTVATVAATGAAFGMAWAFLHGAFRLMQPATARPQGPRLELVQGPRAAARAFGRS